MYLCKQARRGSLFKPTLDREILFLSVACFGKTASVYILLIFPNFLHISAAVPVCASCLFPWCSSLLYLWRRPSGELQPVRSAPLYARSWGQPLKKIQKWKSPLQHHQFVFYFFLKVKLGSVISAEKGRIKNNA